MRLKPIFASVILLGFSSATFAVTHSNANVQAQLSNMQSQLNSMEQVINQNNGLTQTGGGTALQQRVAACPNWYDSINVSGLINVDGVLASRGPTQAFDPGEGDTPYFHFVPFGDHSASDLALDNADLFVDAQVNHWTKAHIGLNYQTVNNNFTTQNATKVAETKRFHDTSLIIKPLASPLIDEAYVTFGNFADSPFYLRVGQQYVNFGNYDRFATVPTFTQLMSQTNETAATLGFVSNGFYGSVYGFRGIPSAVDNSRGTFNINNWGANLGWGMKRQGSSLNLQASYLNNMADVDYISESVRADQPFDAPLPNLMLSQLGYINPNGGVSLDASGNIGPVDAYAHYVTTLDNFDIREVTAEQNIAFVQNNGGANFLAYGANPSALTVGGGVTIHIMNHKSRFGLEYDYSWDAVFVGLYGIPQARFEGMVDMNVSRNVNVGLYLYRDQDYTLPNGGTGRGSTTGVAHIGVMFA